MPDVRIDFDKINQRILALAAARARLRRPSGRTPRYSVRDRGPAARPRSPPGTIVHRHDLRQRRSDVVVSGVRFFEVSANGEKFLTAQADRWTIQTVRPMPRLRQRSSAPAAAAAAPGPSAPPSAAPGAPGPAAPGNFTLRTDDIEVRSDPARRVEADVPRGLAHPARVLLRSQAARPGSRRGDQKYEPYLAVRDVAAGPQLRVRAT